MISVLVAPGTLVAADAITLEDDEQHHLRVRRASAGETVRVLDGAGSHALGTLETHGRSFAVCVEQVERAASPVELVLAVGAGDKDRFGRLAEQCTELGVTTLIPLDTERSRHVESRIRESHLDKLRKRAREACKQCGNPWATVIAPFATLDALPAMAGGRRWFIADPQGAPVPALGAADGVAWVIGPEGGLAAGELELLRTALRAEPVWLGPHILRFESAAVAGAAVTLDRRVRGTGAA
jgi:16S rRNA (uracil1498-N3)-methyltransferase